MNKEILVTQAMPLPEQMFEIAKIGICLAKDQEKLIDNKNAENSRFFTTEEVEYLSVESANEFHTTTHRFTGRIARVGFKEWTMFMAEPVWFVRTVEVEKENVEAEPETEFMSINDGYRSTYAFEWTDKKVTRAQKHIHTKDPDNTGRVQDLLQEHMPTKLDDGFKKIIKKYEAMSRKDCDILTANLQTFAEESRQRIDI